MLQFGLFFLVLSFSISPVFAFTPAEFARVLDRPRSQGQLKPLTVLDSLNKLAGDIANTPQQYKELLARAEPKLINPIVAKDKLGSFPDFQGQVTALTGPKVNTIGYAEKDGYAYLVYGFLPPEFKLDANQVWTLIVRKLDKMLDSPGKINKLAQGLATGKADLPAILAGNGKSSFACAAGPFQSNQDVADHFWRLATYKTKYLGIAQFGRSGACLIFRDERVL